MELKQEFRKTCSSYECDPSVYDSHLPLQNYQNHNSTYHQKSLIYNIDDDRYDGHATKLLIFNTESKTKKAIVLGQKILDRYTCLTQLPNGKLFCFGKSSPVSGITMLIDENGGIERLPSGISCGSSSAIYFNNNVYCFGGLSNGHPLNLSCRFDLDKNRWVNLTPLPNIDYLSSSVTFNRHILISGRRNGDLWLYSIDIDSFSKIPYGFMQGVRKILINAEEKLYLIESFENGFIYESEIAEFTTWKRIGNSIIFRLTKQVYFSYDTEAVHIGCLIHKDPVRYFKFNLNEKSLTEVQ